MLTTEQLADEARALQPDLEALSRAIFEHPELAFKEVFASATIAERLEGQGFAVERPYGGLETSFAARVGSGGPHLGLLLEYDALPEIGHACGHNIIAAGGALAATLIARHLPGGAGRLSVIGTPAEEGGGGKVKLLEAGAFEGLDAVMMFHPADRTLPWRHALAAAHLRVQFRGKAAHAAKSPEEGRSALSAMLQFFAAIDALRQFVPQQARIHGIIRHGGAAPNVVPDFTEAVVYVRDLTAERARQLVERVEACAHGAAMCAGCTTTVEESAPLYTERKNNHTMADLVAGYLAEQGVAVEQPSFRNPVGSSDVGNVSLRVPAIQPYLQIADRGTPGHSVAFRDAAMTPRAHEAAMKMAVALARTGLDVLSDAQLLAQVKREFDTQPADVPDLEADDEE
jgi:amidohydrolase